MPGLELDVNKVTYKDIRDYLLKYKPFGFLSFGKQEKNVEKTNIIEKKIISNIPSSNIGEKDISSSLERDNVVNLLKEISSNTKRYLPHDGDIPVTIHREIDAPRISEYFEEDYRRTPIYTDDTLPIKILSDDYKKIANKLDTIIEKNDYSQ